MIPSSVNDAAARLRESETGRAMTAIVSDLKDLHLRLEMPANARPFRKAIAEVYGIDAKGVVQDWQAAAWNLSTVAGILDSDVMGGAW